jgi:HlyD family secretion protein
MKVPAPSRARLALAGISLVTVVAVACTAMPIPLPFQAQTQATPQAAATPGGLGEKPQGQAPGKPGGLSAGVPVTTAPATRGNIAAFVDFSGTITPVQSTNLVPKTAGRIEKIYVDVGDQIKAGQKLVQLDHGALDAAVSQAEANLQSAQARLQTIQTGARPEDIASAQAALAAQQAKLDQMLRGGRPEDIAAAQAAYDSAQAKLAETQQGTLPADIRAAEQSVQAAQDAFNAAVSNYNKLSTPSPDELAAARAAVDKAQVALQQAQANYDKVGWRPDIAARPESVALKQATDDYQNALAQLKLKQSPRPEDLAAAQKQVDAARAQLDAAKTKLEQLKVVRPEDLTIAQAAADQAAQALAKAKAPNTPQDIEQQRQAVIQAQQNLALKSQPYTQNDLQTAQAAVAQAQAALDAAKVAALEGAVLAPYDGVVTARLLAEGGLTNATTPVLSVATKDNEIVINVEEARIGQLQVGMPATITVPAFPGVTFPAKVTSISPTADQKTHTFPIKVRPDPQDPRLLGGMFAAVRIQTQRKNDVVLVPKDAVVQRTGKTQIYVVENGRAKAIDVSGGLSDDKNVEVPSGVNPGDLVIVQGQSTVNDGDAVRTAGAGQGGQGQAAQAGQGGAPGKPQGGQGGQGAARPEATPSSSSTPTR